MKNEPTAASVKTSAAKQRKIDTVTNLTEKVNKAKVMVLADYRGIKHKQLEELRRNLKKSDGEFVVAKNRLVLRALRSAQGKPSERSKPSETTDQILPSLTDTTAVLFAYKDEVAPLKELLKFFKAVGLGKTKAGIMGSSVMTDADVTKLATLPARDVLLGTLVRQLNAPIQGLHYALQWNINKFVWALNSIKEKKTV